MSEPGSNIIDYRVREQPRIHVTIFESFHFTGFVEKKFKSPLSTFSIHKVKTSFLLLTHLLEQVT